VDCCAEFEVERIDLPPHTVDYQPVRVSCGCIYLVQNLGSTAGDSTIAMEAEGSTLHLKEGAVVFTAAGEAVKITTGAGGATLFRAHVNLGGTEKLFREC
jgi:hypothetical protein